MPLPASCGYSVHDDARSRACRKKRKTVLDATHDRKEERYLDTQYEPASQSKIDHWNERVAGGEAMPVSRSKDCSKGADETSTADAVPAATDTLFRVRTSNL